MVYHMIEFNRFCDISASAIPRYALPCHSSYLTNVVHCHFFFTYSEKEQGEEGEGKSLKTRLQRNQLKWVKTRVLMYGNSPKELRSKPRAVVLVIQEELLQSQPSKKREGSCILLDLSCLV
jgi:hypothetical protein